VEVSSGRVIAGVSGSVRSLGALRAGLAEARSSGAELVAVLAWAPSGGEFAYMRAPCPMLLRLCEEAAQERVREAFDAAFGGVPWDVSVRMLVVRARPGQVLVDMADRPDDLLVVGCGGRGRLGRTIHGSVTRYCIAHARCPVLAVPPPELIADMRSWPHRWRPELITAPLAGAKIANGDKGEAESADGPAGRAIAPARPRPAGAPGRPRPGPEETSAMANLPAYRGAPYYQPRQRSRRYRALRQLRVALALAIVAALIAFSWVLLSQGTIWP
jgi:nucleotide-binding universal stress UspA family protein